MNNSLSLRQKLRPSALRLNPQRRETEIIILEPGKRQDNPATKSVANLFWWNQHFNLKQRNSQILKDSYHVILLSLEKNLLNLRDETSYAKLSEAKVSQFLRQDDDCVQALALLSRSNRKLLVSRLKSLYIERAPIILALDQDNILGSWFQGDFQIRQLQLNGLINSQTVFEDLLEPRILGELLRSPTSSTNKWVINKKALCEELSMSTIDAPHFFLKKLPATGVAMLEVIKRKIVPLEYGKTLTQFINNPPFGLLVCGARLTAKSTLISGLLSMSSPLSNPLLIGNRLEIRNTHPNLQFIDPELFNRDSSSFSIHRLIEDIAKLMPDLLFIDDASPSLLLLALELQRSYGIPSIASIRSLPTGRSLTKILHLTQKTSDVPGSITAEDFCDTFPLAFHLSLGENYGPSLKEVSGLQYREQEIYLKSLLDPMSAITSAKQSM